MRCSEGVELGEGYICNADVKAFDGEMPGWVCDRHVILGHLDDDVDVVT